MIEEIKHEGSTFTAPTRQKRTAMVIAAGLLLTFLVADPRTAEYCEGQIISPGNFCVPTFYAWSIFLFPAGYFLYSFKRAIESEASFLNPTAQSNLTLYDQLTKLNDDIKHLKELEKNNAQITLNQKTYILTKQMYESPEIYDALKKIKPTFYTGMHFGKRKDPRTPLTENEMKEELVKLHTIRDGIKIFLHERPRTEVLSAMRTEKNANLFDYKLPYWFSQAVLAFAAMRVLYELARITWPVVSGILS